MDTYETYVLLDESDTEMSEECDTAQEARNARELQEWEPDVGPLTVARKIYTFTEYQRVEE